MSALIAVTDSTFGREVLQAELPTLVDFWAEWCAPCRTMAPLLEKLAEEQAGALKIVQLDAQANPDTALRYEVMNLPTLILFVAGEPRKRLAGFMPVKKIMERVARYL